jgi:superfamily I DNA/RNA helicase
MLTLAVQKATAEQLPLISASRIGVEIIRGAAGSGKTTTALLRLESLAHIFEARRTREKTAAPVRILVLTFNRTLAGYVEKLAKAQLANLQNVSYEIRTFGAWASRCLGDPLIIDEDERNSLLESFLKGIELPLDFLLTEIDYICGRFTFANLDDYLGIERTGRGTSPQVARPLRIKILTAVRNFYSALTKHQNMLYTDWHRVTEAMLSVPSRQYDIVIVDEAQDFSANQIRAINHHLAKPASLALVMDTAQRLYPRGFTWTETGLDIQNARFHRLQTNHRNTVEIATFAAGILKGLPLDEDGTTPDFSKATKRGRLPIVYEGYYSEQLSFAIEWIRTKVDLTRETVAFLKPRGGLWFKEVRNTLTAEKLPYVEITRDRDWPEGPENIALSTMHSSKGLEFDHVVILGLSAKNTPHGMGEDDDALLVLRRLLAMAVSRARKSVIVGYKNTEASDLIRFFEPATFELRKP